MANEEQLSILKQGVRNWNEWRRENPGTEIDLYAADLSHANLRNFNLSGANLGEAVLREADLRDAYLSGANLVGANVVRANLFGTDLTVANLTIANLDHADLSEAQIIGAVIRSTNLSRCNTAKAVAGDTVFGNIDLTAIIGLDKVLHRGPSSISTDVFTLSKGRIPEIFLQGCGLSNIDIEYVRLSNPDLSNEEISKILYKIYDLRASQAVQVSPLFISYGHGDGAFVDKLEVQLNEKGIRYWRDIHEMKAGRLEKQIDRAIRQNPTVLLVLSEHSLSSDWVEHEVRTARGLEKETGRDILCPVALDDSWKSSHWPKRIMEQIMEYNILDFSEWEDDSRFDGMFRKLIDGLELFYKG